MKDKWHHLPLPQRVLLLLQAFLVVLFLILYATFGRQQVIEYHNTLFRCRTDGDTTVYSGTLDGEKAVFTVSPGPVVEFRWGDALYGPYTITEDSTAIPEQQAMPEFFTSSEYLTGVEVRRGSDVLFRGACHILGGSLSFLIAEDGSYDSFSVSVIADSKDVYKRQEPRRPAERWSCPCPARRSAGSPAGWLPDAPPAPAGGRK